MGATEVAFFIPMNIYIYSDESGTFDYKHNDYFVFGGVILFGEDEKDECSRKYAHVENLLKETKKYKPKTELKACHISNSEKGKFYRSLNNTYKFCVLLKQKYIKKEIFDNKKHKQRYLDYAYKLVLKKCFKELINKRCIKPDDVENIVVYCDEHITATDGKYELRENLLNEFKNGTFNPEWNLFYEPIFPHLYDVKVEFCDSKTTRLIRAADIIANHCWHQAISNYGHILAKPNLFVLVLPENVVVSSGIEFFFSPEINQINHTLMEMDIDLDGVTKKLK